jgi:hypothetical protein
MNQENLIIANIVMVGLFLAKELFIMFRTSSQNNTKEIIKNTIAITELKIKIEELNKKLEEVGTLKVELNRVDEKVDDLSQVMFTILGNKDSAKQ